MGYSWRVSVLGHVISINFNAYCENVLDWKKEGASSFFISETKPAMDLMGTLKRVLRYLLVLHLLNDFTGVLVKCAEVWAFKKRSVLANMYLWRSLSLNFTVKYPAAQNPSSIQL